MVLSSGLITPSFPASVSACTLSPRNAGVGVGRQEAALFSSSPVLPSVLQQWCQVIYQCQTVYAGGTPDSPLCTIAAVSLWCQQARAPLVLTHMVPTPASGMGTVASVLSAKCLHHHEQIEGGTDGSMPWWFLS